MTPSHPFTPPIALLCALHALMCPNAPLICPYAPLHTPMHPYAPLTCPFMHTLCPYVPLMCPLQVPDWLRVPRLLAFTNIILHKILTFPHHLLKRSHAARIDELADSNEPAIIQFCLKIYDLLRHTHL